MAYAHTHTVHGCSPAECAPRLATALKAEDTSTYATAASVPTQHHGNAHRRADKLGRALTVRMTHNDADSHRHARVCVCVSAVSVHGRSPEGVPTPAHPAGQYHAGLDGGGDRAGQEDPAVSRSPELYVKCDVCVCVFRMCCVWSFEQSTCRRRCLHRKLPIIMNGSEPGYYGERGA